MEEEKEFQEQLNVLFETKKQLSHFDYDYYDWGCLWYMLELWIFLNRRHKQGIQSISGFFANVLFWLTAEEELRRYDGRDHTAASMLAFLPFTKLARMKTEEAVE